MIYCVQDASERLPHTHVSPALSPSPSPPSPLQVCQQLHNLWSAPLRILVCVVLLYRQLGLASLFGLVVLLLMIPSQVRLAQANVG